MQIDDIKYDENSFNLRDTLLKMTNDTNQKILLIEIMALIYSDRLHQAEQKILDFIIEQYNINEVLVTVYADWTKSILAITNQGSALINL